MDNNEAVEYFWWRDKTFVFGVVGIIGIIGVVDRFSHQFRLLCLYTLTSLVLSMVPSCLISACQHLLPLSHWRSTRSATPSPNRNSQRSLPIIPHSGKVPSSCPSSYVSKAPTAKAPTAKSPSFDCDDQYGPGHDEGCETHRDGEQEHDVEGGSFHCFDGVAVLERGGQLGGLLGQMFER